MIQDVAEITLSNGTRKPAIEVSEGGEVVSLENQRLTKSRVLHRTIVGSTDVIGLIFSNGRKLCGSREQKVATYRSKNVHFHALSDVEIGDRVVGEESGLRTVLTVIGLAFSPNREVRLVHFDIEKGRTFIANGVLCR